MSRKGQFITLLVVLVLYLLVPRWLQYPLDLFLTFIHEAGHALAALVSGGEVLELVVDPNMAGYTRSAGGWRPLIISGGYLGVAVVGALLLRLNTTSARRYVLEGCAATVLGLTLLYAGDGFTRVLGFGAAVVLAAIGLYTNDFVEYVTVNFLGVYVGLGALKEFPVLWKLHGGAARVSAGGAAGVTDAEAMAALTGLHANIWVVLWLLVAVVLLGRELKRGAGIR
jgi:hypothetical protein